MDLLSPDAVRIAENLLAGGRVVVTIYVSALGAGVMHRSACRLQPHLGRCASTPGLGLCKAHSSTPLLLYMMDHGCRGGTTPTPSLRAECDFTQCTAP